MTVEELAISVIQACEAEKIPHMITGAFAYNAYGIPRSTKDVDFVIDVTGNSVNRVINRLEPTVEFGNQVQFDTLTWGRRHIGKPREGLVVHVELFELFDDPFVKEQFRRRIYRASDQLHLQTWLPTAEDIVIQKIRWARSKDLDDARDVLAVQGLENLDMSYIEKWCEIHKTTNRLNSIISSLPEF
ncbi:MAG: hypothetical protein HC845_08955 [Akkermansiaceae bacterium]|nr:hypothetical protein [Akkermansiaceae bacterium]